MLLQRTRAAESRVKHKSSNGPRRVQSNVLFAQSILQRDDIRQLSGICKYPEESAVSANQGGTTDKIYSSLTEEYFSVGDFFILILLRRFFI